MKQEIDNEQNVQVSIDCECSGAIEHYFEKYNGIKIENVYVPEYLGANIQIKPIDDYHYERLIGNIMIQKVIFGFNTSDTFNKIYAERKEYIDDCINRIKKGNISEGVLKMSLDLLADWNFHMDVVEFFLKEKEKGYNEYPAESLVYLQDSVGYLKKELLRGHVIHSYGYEMKELIRKGTEMLETVTILELQKF